MLNCGGFFCNLALWSAKWRLWSADCVHPKCLGVFAQWSDLHNSFNEVGIKTSQTEHRNKQHYQWVCNSFL